LIDCDERKQLESMSTLAKTYRPSGKPMSEEVCAAAMYQYANKRLSGVKRDGFGFGFGFTDELRVIEPRIQRANEC
jgi:hypothetical protein